MEFYKVVILIILIAIIFILFMDKHKMLAGSIFKIGDIITFTLPDKQGYNRKGIITEILKQSYYQVAYTPEGYTLRNWKVININKSDIIRKVGYTDSRLKIDKGFTYNTYYMDPPIKENINVESDKLSPIKIDDNIPHTIDTQFTKDLFEGKKDINKLISKLGRVKLLEDIDVFKMLWTFTAIAYETDHDSNVSNTEYGYKNKIESKFNIPKIDLFYDGWEKKLSTIIDNHKITYGGLRFDWAESKKPSLLYLFIIDRDNNSYTIVLVSRGTHGSIAVSDIAADLKIGRTPLILGDKYDRSYLNKKYNVQYDDIPFANLGMLTYAQIIQNSIGEIISIKKVFDKKGLKFSNIIFCGHSLGCAIASLLPGLVMNSFGIKGIDTDENTKPRVHMFGLSGPGCMNLKASNDIINYIRPTSIYEVFNGHDAVHNLPENSSEAPGIIDSGLLGNLQNIIGMTTYMPIQAYQLSDLASKSTYNPQQILTMKDMKYGRRNLNGIHYEVIDLQKYSGTMHWNWVGLSVVDYHSWFRLPNGEVLRMK